MASGKGIEGPPSALISLDNPVDREHGRFQASVVQRLHGSRKRKRSELAVGIDTSGIKIYDVCDMIVPHFPLLTESEDPKSSPHYVLFAVTPNLLPCPALFDIL